MATRTAFSSALRPVRPACDAISAAPLPAFMPRRFYSVGTPNRRPTNRWIWWMLTGATTAGTCYVLGAKYPPRAIPFIFSPYSTNASDMSADEAAAHCHEIERAMHSLPIVQEHLSRSFEYPSAKEVREKHGITYDTELANRETADYAILRPFVHVPPGRLETQLTAGSLRGAHMFATTPMIFSKTQAGVRSGGGTEGDGFVVLHLGKNLCGYEGVVHGGLIATVFDEALARTAFYGLPSNVGVTGKLELRYRKPVVADRFYVVETEIVERIGRKCFVNGYLLEPKSRSVLAEANGVFIEPRWAKYASWVGGVNIRKQLEK